MRFIAASSAGTRCRRSDDTRAAAHVVTVAI